MRTTVILLLSACLLMAGCDTKPPSEPLVTTIVQKKPSIGTEFREQPEEEIPEENAASVTYLRVFRIENQTMLDGSGKIIHGKVLSESDDSSLEDRFVKAQTDNGIYPPYKAIMLWFEQEIPEQIHWSTDDGFGFGNQGTMVSKGENQITIELGANYGALLNSNLESVCNRKVRIICQYPDYSIEYLIVMSS